MLSVRLKKTLGNFTLDVAWEMDRESMVLFGPSGAGKTITLQMLAGLDEARRRPYRVGRPGLLRQCIGHRPPASETLPGLCVSG